MAKELTIDDKNISRRSYKPTALGQVRIVSHLSFENEKRAFFRWLAAFDLAEA
ncbi:MAG: hypothetical protein LKG11_02430 [Bacilli bacterium]|nr:hypothetical protein [Bacilli bacterium]